MDPICVEKINFLQKYIPFLANLIDLWANDSEKVGKLSQMQLLYDLLHKPDNSVKIETLEKCEEVLSRVFANAEKKHDEDNGQSKENILWEPNPLIKSKLLQKTDQDARRIEMENVQVNSENSNGCSEELSCKADEKSFMEIATTGDKENSPEHKLMEENPIENYKTENKSVSPSESKDSQINESGKEKIKDTANENTLAIEANEDGMTNETAEELLDGSENILSTEATAMNTETESHLSIKQINNFEENSLLVAINETTHIDNHENITQTEYGLSEADESETFILPDDGDSLNPLSGIKGTTDCEHQEEKVKEDEQKDIIRQNESEMLPFKIISAESLAIRSVKSLSEDDDLNSKQTDKVNRLNDTAKEGSLNLEDLDPLDPLLSPPENLLEISKTIPIENSSVNSIPSNNEKEEDDDDVLLIETRSSPICIDSDPEEEEKQNRSLPIMTSKAPVSMQQKQRTSARKSTSVVMDTIRHIIKHQQVTARKVSSHKKLKMQRNSAYLLKKDPKVLMETINLIDSDSDDEDLKRVQKSRKKDDDVIIINAAQPQRRIVHSKKITSAPLLKHNARFPSKLANKPAAKHTAQSNFLNAVNLQPARKSNSNPASFSAQLSNKKVIIPNAFYGNPSYNRKPTSSSVAVAVASQDESSSNDSMSRSFGSSSTVSIRQVQERMLKEWLEGFLTNFASPLQLASHACFVLLQRVLKYRFFLRLKETRVNLNTLAKNFVPETMDVQMLLDLRNVFLQNDNLTEAGRRFCRFATNDAFGKPVALTTDSRTGKVTCRTRIGSKTDIQTEMKTTKSNNLDNVPTTATVTSANPVPSISTTPISNMAKRNRKLRKLSDGTFVADGDGDNDYTPYMGELVLEKEIITERKKSLRTNRTKRKEAGFTYSEDHDDEEFEALAKKIEDKKKEELRLAEEKEMESERERERKVKKTTAKKTTSKRQGNGASAQIGIPKEPTRKKLRLVDTEIIGNADDDLLTPTWVEADDDYGDDAEVDSLQDFADESESPETHISENDNNLMEDNPVAGTVQESNDSDSDTPSFDVGTNKLLKNTDRGLHTQSKSFDFCVHCLRRVPRTVHHYVNDHRSSEVFNSRLRTKDIRRLLTTSNVGFANLYKGNQQQYAAHCIFCNKVVKFLLPYWFEHFTMHTGEYSFKCSGCNIRKPTRSLLTNHLQSGTGCPKQGSAMRLYIFDTKSNQIEGHICAVCNYVQIHRNNLLRHLRIQHGIETVSVNHIIKVVLLQVSGPYRDQKAITNDESQLSLLQHSDEEETYINGASTTSLDDNSLMMQNDFTDNDDLSFMICGMLDVQSNLSVTGETLRDVDKTNIVDNK